MSVRCGHSESLSTVTENHCGWLAAFFLIHWIASSAAVIVATGWVRLVTNPVYHGCDTKTQTYLIRHQALEEQIIFVIIKGYVTKFNFLHLHRGESNRMMMIIRLASSHYCLTSGKHHPSTLTLCRHNTSVMWCMAVIMDLSSSPPLGGAAGQAGWLKMCSEQRLYQSLLLLIPNPHFLLHY